MALLRDHGDCVWMDPSQIGIHRGIDSDARGIQCDSVLVPGVVDDRGSLHLSRGVLETRVSPRRVIFAPLEPVIDSLLPQKALAVRRPLSRVVGAKRKSSNEDSEIYQD
jgi:hypothetical protein